jgi:hypothetical protein
MTLNSWSSLQNLGTDGIENTDSKSFSIVASLCVAAEVIYWVAAKQCLSFSFIMSQRIIIPGLGDVRNFIDRPEYILWPTLRCYQCLVSITRMSGRLMNLKGFGRKRLWRNQGRIPEFARTVCGRTYKPQSGWRVSCPGFEQRTSRIRSRRATHSLRTIAKAGGMKN